MLAQKVCLRLVIQLLHRLLTPVAEFIIILPSTALYCNPIFFTYKLLHVEGRGAANRQWKIPDISSFVCIRSCSQPYLCLPALPCAQVTQQKYLEQDANMLTSRHWGFGGWIFLYFSTTPAYCLLYIFSLFFPPHCLNSTKLWRAEALACDSRIHRSLISLSFRSLSSYQLLLIKVHSQCNTAQQAEVEMLIPSIWLLGKTKTLNQQISVQHEARVWGQTSLGLFCFVCFCFILFV